MPLFIRPSSLPSIVAAEEAIANGQTPRAAAAVRVADDSLRDLRADYGRTSRWLYGMLGVAGALAAGLLAGAAIDQFVADGSGALLLVLAVAVGAASAWLLITLQRSGRILVRALSFWAGYPFRPGQRRPQGRGHFFLRLLGPDSDLYTRTFTAAVAALWALFAVSMIRFGIAEYPTPAVTVIASVWLVTLVPSAIGQYGGVLRVQRAYRAGLAARP